VFAHARERGAAAVYTGIMQLLEGGHISRQKHTNSDAAWGASVSMHTLSSRLRLCPTHEQRHADTQDDVATASRPDTNPAREQRCACKVKLDSERTLWTVFAALTSAGAKTRVRKTCVKSLLVVPEALYTSVPTVSVLLSFQCVHLGCTLLTHTCPILCAFPGALFFHQMRILTPFR
jgi:hypothetical protein